MKIIGYTLLFLLLSLPVFAQTTQYDAICNNQVRENTRNALTTEIIYDAGLGAVEEENKKSKSYMDQIFAAKTLFFLAKNNLRGFGAESRAYKSMIKLTASVVKQLIEIIEKSADSPLQAVTCHKLVTQITAEATSLTTTMVSVAMGAQVPNPLGGTSVDGLNLLDPYERLKVCDSTLASLRRLDNTCRAILWKLDHEVPLMAVFREIAPLDAYYLTSGREIAGNIISEFRRR